jgi:hypothetical protein
MTFFLSLGCSFWLPDILDAEMDGAWDDSWKGHFTVWLYLAAKPSHGGGGGGVGGEGPTSPLFLLLLDIDGLACPLHHPIAYSYEET